MKRRSPQILLKNDHFIEAVRLTVLVESLCLGEGDVNHLSLVLLLRGLVVPILFLTVNRSLNHPGSQPQRSSKSDEPEM